MARWNVNSLPLEKTVLTAKKITTPWASSVIPIYAQKAVVNLPGKNAQPIAIDMYLNGSGRYALESSIRAELENCPTIYLSTTIPGEYAYDTDKFVWVTPQNFSVDDPGSIAPLKCRITGFVDEKIVHSCNFLTGWTNSGSTITTISGNPRGTNCIKSSRGAQITYTPAQALDFSKAANLCSWIKSDTASSGLTTYSATMFSGAAYYTWTMTTCAADTWTYQEFDLYAPNSQSGTMNLASITSFRYNFGPVDNAKYIHLGWIFID